MINFFKNASLIFFTPLLTFVLGIIANSLYNRQKSKYAIRKEKLMKVYYPIFKFLEPFLYKNVKGINKKEIFNYCDKIFYDNYILVDSKVLNYYNILKKDPTDSNYEKFCASVDKEFEKNKLWLGYPRRTYTYKINNNQFPKEIPKWKIELEILVFQFLAFFGIFIIIVSLIYLYQYFWKSIDLITGMFTS